MRLIPIESGWMTCDTNIMCEGGYEGEGDRVRFPVSCWVVEHDQGLVMFDTGMHAELQQNPERIGFAANVFDIEMRGSISAALTRQGIPPDDIKFIVFSHLHFDHCGGTAEIPNATIIVQREEWKAGLDPRNVDRGTYDPSDFHLGHQVIQVEGEHDIYGDGKLVCVPTPGHTPGHQCLLVSLKSGPRLLVGDCCYFSGMLEPLRLPLMSFDRELQVASMRRLLAYQASGAHLLFGHDREQWLAVNRDSEALP